MAALLFLSSLLCGPYLALRGCNLVTQGGFCHLVAGSPEVEAPGAGAVFRSEALVPEARRPVPRTAGSIVRREKAAVR